MEEQWSLSLGTNTRSTDSKLLLSCRLRPKGCIRDIEGGCTIWFKPFPGVCVCDDDRRERAQGVSCTEFVVVKLSQNILLLTPHVSDKGLVLRSVWHTEGEGKGRVWLPSAPVEGWLPCTNANCFPSLCEDPRKRSCLSTKCTWWWCWLCNLASAEELTSPPFHGELIMALEWYTCGFEKGSNWVPEKSWISQVLYFISREVYANKNVKM